MANFFDLVQGMGKQAYNNPIGTAAGIGILAGGLGAGVSAISDPIGTVEKGAIGFTALEKYGMGGSLISQYVTSDPITSAAVGGGALLAGGLLVAGARKVGKNASVASVATMGKKLGSFAAMPPGLPSKVAGVGGNVAGLAVKGYGALWDKMGPGVPLVGAVALGGLYGGAKAFGKMALSTGGYEEAMARSVEGSAYEQGAGSFGKRSQGSRIRSLGSSTVGLTQGLHNRR